MSRIVGTCSNCGALIVEPDAWFSTIPWVPSCDRCGATKKLPVVEMEPPPANLIYKYVGSVTHKEKP